MFNKERILLLPLFFSISQNFFQTIWKSFSVKSSEGRLSSSSFCLSSVDFLKFKLAKEREETSLVGGGVNSLLLVIISWFPNSKTSSFFRFFNSEVLIKDFFF